MKYKIGIAASRYNSAYVDAMVATAQKILENHTLLIRRVPGAFEIPLAVQRLLDKEKVDAVLAFGVIWKGQTDHADLIARAVTDALLDLSLRFDRPVLHEVLTVQTEAQARARCLGSKLNRGREAAEAVLGLLAES
ncbi:MAG: 6,7-dimethyl-8-ribityllumazine synthase [Candidatus Methylacidiphilales bacterium]